MAEYLTYEDNHFTVSDSPFTIDVVTDFGHNRTSILLRNDGPGDLLVSTSSDNGATYGDTFTVRGAESFGLSLVGIEQIRLSHSGIDSSYRVFIGSRLPTLSLTPSRIPPDVLLTSGNIKGVTPVTKVGRNSSIGTTEEDIWSGGGIWIPPTIARTHQISSTSLNDTEGGSGARLLLVRGLESWSTKETSEIITMNGISDVPTKDYVIINQLLVISGVNVGTITAVADVDGTISAQINPDQGTAQMMIFGVPSVQTAYFKNYFVSFNRSNPSFAAVNFRALLNFEPDVDLTSFIVGHRNSLSSEGTSKVDYIFDPPVDFAGPFIVKFAAQCNAMVCDVSAGFGVVLVDNLI